MSKNLNQNQKLNKENIFSDEDIIDLYFKRDEDAITYSDLKYGAYCNAVALNILKNKEDSSECVSDTWLRSWNVIPPERPSILRAFFARITRNLALDRYRENHSQKRGSGEVPIVIDELENCISGKDDIENSVITKELTQAINQFLRSVSPKERNVFIRRYYFFEDADQIANKYHMTNANVRKVLSRTRLKLKNYLIKEGFEV